MNERNVYSVPEMRRVRRIHMIGVGGSGMNGIAEVLVNLGYEVSGSDLQRSASTERLENAGVTVFIGHDAAHVTGADVIVASSAVGDENPEVVQRLLKLAQSMRQDLGDYDRVGTNMRFFDLQGPRPTKPPVPAPRKPRSGK